MIIHNKTSKKHAGAPRSSLRRGIQIALTSGLLVSGFAGAALRDHGPLNGTNYFPDWYREDASEFPLHPLFYRPPMALGQCIVPDETVNGPLCLLAGVDPNGFPGNFGEEGFYATADVIAGGFHWMGHLEMAYMTPNGAPPATVDRNNSQGVVFSRERMIFDVPAGCAGHYTIRTPFKVHELDLEVGRRSLFYTDDIAPNPGDFNAALKGHTGPFLIWDGPQPAVTVPQIVGPAHHFIGDPNVLHTFIGSKLKAGPGHEDKVFNNYLEVIPPANCDLGAGPGVSLFEDTASISGLIWDQPIVDPVKITKASFSRNATTSSLNVWATGPSGQEMILTSRIPDPELPSTPMKEQTNANNQGTGNYFAHLEFNPAVRPSQVTVTNLAGVPALTASNTEAVSDAIIITKANYDTATKRLCIAAHLDDVDKLNEILTTKFGNLGAPTPTCGGAANDKFLETTLGDSVSGFQIPQEPIVVSYNGTEETSKIIVSANGQHSDGVASNLATAQTFDGIRGTGITSLPLTASVTFPHRIVITKQPDLGTVTAHATGGTVSYQAIEGMATSTQDFHYAIQNTSTGAVSNVEAVTLNVIQEITPPIAVADAQGVFRTSTGANINVLANDVTGLTPTSIDPSTVQLQPLAGYTLGAGGKSLSGPRGTATVLNNGTVSFVPGTTGRTAANNVVFSFQYTVANTAGKRSVPTNVSVVFKTAAEAIGFTRVRFANGWDVRFTSTYAGAAGTVTLAPTATCRVYANAAAFANRANIDSAANLIGIAAPGAGTNAYVVTGSLTPPATWVVGCVTSSGGASSRGAL